jgi:protein TonB
MTKLFMELVFDCIIKVYQFFNQNQFTMKTNYENTRMLDMIFENRNKSYGAYALRSTSNSRTSKALLITFTSILLLGFGKLVSDKMKGNYTMKSGPIVIAEPIPEVHFEKPEIKIDPPKPQVEQPQAIAAERNTEMHVTTNEQASDSVPTVEQLRNVESGISTNLNGNTRGATDGQGAAETFEVAQATPVSNQPLIRSEIMPEFPGGDEALLRFLHAKTIYPDYERDIDIEGKALVRFVVNEDGTISNATVIKKDSPGFAKEALRVVAMMPKFKPGIQQGKAVKVQFVLPFQFKLAH